MNLLERVIVDMLCQGLAVGRLLAGSILVPAAEFTACWNPWTTHWNINTRPAIGDWAFDCPGYPPGLNLQGGTVHERELFFTIPVPNEPHCY